MFKKADKNELRTWFIGSVLMFAVALLVGVIQVGSLIQNGFSVGKLILSIVFVGLAALFLMFIIKIAEAYKSFDTRKANNEKEEKERKEREEAELKLKHEQEKHEME